MDLERQWSIFGVNCPPMTVIVSSYLPGKGFMLAADGLRSDGATREPISTTTQKIHFGDHPDFKFAYAWTGGVRFSTMCGCDFDFAERTGSLIKDMREIAYSSAHAFILDVAWLLYVELGFRLPGLRLFPPTNPPDLLAACLFAGYFRGKPFEAEIFYRHDGGILQPYEIRRIESFDGGPSSFYRFSGSQTVFESLISSAPEFMSEAIEMAIKYIQKCEDGCGVIPDCKGFGGHIHAASVNPDGQPSWIIEPVSL